MVFRKHARWQCMMMHKNKRTNNFYKGDYSGPLQCTRFHLPRTLYFSLLSFNECSLFLLLRLAFIFRLDFCSDLVLSLHQGVFGPLVYVGIHQKRCFKKVWIVLEKRKSFLQKSGTKRSLFRLRLRLFHVMLDVVLIVCLVIFAVAWLVSYDWDCLMSL
jgi:hypothetical protein